MAAAKECLGIVGVGLIGGSIGLAARRTGRYAPILGVDRDPQALELAKARGCIDDADELPAVAKQADVIVFCTPVDQIADQVLVSAEHCGPDTLLTDTGSTKAAIVEAIEARLAKDRLFIGSHPLAGSEKGGPENARADLFDGRLAVLTITKRTPDRAPTRGIAFWESLGCRAWAMTPDHHDNVLALTSHLPHLVAAALAKLLGPELCGLVASGFRDTTRLASGNPNLWTPIFLQNAGHLVKEVERLERLLVEFREALNERDATTVRRLLTEAKGVRDDLGS